MKHILPRQQVICSSIFRRRAPLLVPVKLARIPYTQSTVLRSEASSSSIAIISTNEKRLALRLWDAYVHALHEHPLRTKATFAAIIFFTSDSATQYITYDDSEADFQWDAPRALSGASFGVIATGWLHYWWGFLEASVGKRIPIATHKMLNTATKVLIDQSIGAPLYIYTYYVLTNFLNDVFNGDFDSDWRDSWRDTNAKAREMLWSTMLQHWRVWIPVHSCNFYFTPFPHRVLVQNNMLVFWSGYLSYLNHNQNHIMTPDQEIKASIVRRQTEQQLLQQQNDRLLKRQGTMHLSSNRLIKRATNDASTVSS